jgi:RNA-directed DNA polymerase
MSFEERIRRVNSYCIGWLGYFQLAKCKRFLQEMEGWIRRKLRCVRLKQCKRVKTMAELFMSLGVEDFNAWMQAASGKGWWRMARTRTAHRAMNNDWFREQGLVSLIGRYEVLKVGRNRRGTEQVCPVV